MGGVVTEAAFGPCKALGLCLRDMEAVSGRDMTRFDSSWLKRVALAVTDSSRQGKVDTAGRARGPADGLWLVARC